VVGNGCQSSRFARTLGWAGQLQPGYTLPRVITSDLDRALATAISPAGTWRPASPGTAGGSRAYVTTVAFRLANGQPGGPGAVAARLAARLRGLDWVETATVTGGGYLMVTVTAAALARLAVRVTQAGSGCARSSALAGTDLTRPAPVDLTSAGTWEEARQRVHAAVTARLAEAAGARVEQHDAERIAAPDCPAPVTATSPVTPPSPAAAPFPVTASSLVTASSPVAGPSPATVPSVVAGAIAYAGADAITYALARLPPWGPARVDARLAAAHHLGNPAYAVRYAHAHAASALRQAADLGLDRGEAAQFQPRLLAHPREQALLYELSWLPERVAGAARRARPDVFVRYLEGLARVYFDGQEDCPAVRPGMAVPGASPGERAAVQAAARLWLAAAARTALLTGLGLLGVGAPDRL
jgi:arginyl-tRNA synthetase